VIARAECYQLRGDLAFVRALAHDGDAADPLAHAAAIFMVLGDSE
jgi:acyl-coenzyme A thioesterase PaaI-like protein